MRLQDCGPRASGLEFGLLSLGVEGTGLRAESVGFQGWSSLLMLLSLQFTVESLGFGICRAGTHTNKLHPVDLWAQTRELLLPDER